MTSYFCVAAFIVASCVSAINGHGYQSGPLAYHNIGYQAPQGLTAYGQPGYGGYGAGLASPLAYSGDAYANGYGAGLAAPLTYGHGYGAGIAGAPYQGAYGIAGGPYQGAYGIAGAPYQGAYGAGFLKKKK